MMTPTRPQPVSAEDIYKIPLDPVLVVTAGMLVDLPIGSHDMVRVRRNTRIDLGKSKQLGIPLGTDGWASLQGYILADVPEESLWHVLGSIRVETKGPNGQMQDGAREYAACTGFDLTEQFPRDMQEGMTPDKVQLMEEKDLLEQTLRYLPISPGAWESFLYCRDSDFSCDRGKMRAKFDRILSTMKCPNLVWVTSDEKFTRFALFSDPNQRHTVLVKQHGLYATVQGYIKHDTPVAMNFAGITMQNLIRNGRCLIAAHHQLI
jgi:hypothetical protein